MLQIAGDPPRGGIAIHRRGWTADDLHGAAIAIGAFEDDEGAAAFAAAARAAGVPVNVIDKPAFCDFAFGAIVNRSPLGDRHFDRRRRAGVRAGDPRQARSAAAEGLRRLGRGGRALARGGEGLRPVVRRPAQVLAAVHRARGDAIPTASRRKTTSTASSPRCKGLGAAVENGSVTLVGAGPGDPELLTLRAVRALQSADVILFDDLVSRDVLDFARREARKMLVGKTGFGPSCKQDDINALMVGLAKQGKRVVRLKGGDPLIFGRAGEEIAACQAAGDRGRGRARHHRGAGRGGRLGLPLTDREHARRLQYVTGHAHDGALPADLDWQSLADPATTTAIYMPARTLAALVAKATAEGLDPQTPALAIARATRPDQAVVAAPIGELPTRLAHAALSGPVLVMLGHVFGDKAVAQAAHALRSESRLSLSACRSGSAPRSRSACRPSPAAAAALARRAPPGERRAVQEARARTARDAGVMHAAAAVDAEGELRHAVLRRAPAPPAGSACSVRAGTTSCDFQFGNALGFCDDAPGAGAAARAARFSAGLGALARLACFCGCLFSAGFSTDFSTAFSTGFSIGFSGGGPRAAVRPRARAAWRPCARPALAARAAAALLDGLFQRLRAAPARP